MKNSDFVISADQNEPIYKQLANQITAAINDGVFRPGDRLPTGKEMLEKYKISRGTLNAAYKQLAKNGLITVTQGKGTFVRGHETASHSIETIDYYLDELSKLLSLDELEALIYRQLQQYSRSATVRIAVVESCPEIQSFMVESLSSFKDISISAYQVEQLLEESPSIMKNDLFVSEQSNLARLMSTDQMSEKKDSIAPVALTYCSDSLCGFAAIPSGASIGLLCNTRKFFETCRWELSEIDSALMPNSFFPIGNHSSADFSVFLAKSTVVLTIGEPDRLLCEEQLQLLQEWADRGGQIILLKKTLDKGSMLYIGDCIRELLMRGSTKRTYVSSK
ncbi:MAG: winged helix-turn-helix transcriptional regulator [Oscillospiraceae bacterium]|nr:winged helix-turn-helix transcriptional regulator [Oscillospiraceae bacterium]MBR6207996.1 winged helix-turn-helix transcriptional regulator [Oscillospiraceae bacterium]